MGTLFITNLRCAISPTSHRFKPASTSARHVFVYYITDMSPIQEGKSAIIRSDELYLCDSGGQYLGTSVHLLES